MPECEPLRMCVGCKSRKAKSALIRVARGENGMIVETDRSISGRGAYMCRSSDCVESAFSGRRLLRVSGKCVPADLDRLKREIVNRIR